jgi:hypothetical protein
MAFVIREAPWSRTRSRAHGDLPSSRTGRSPFPWLALLGVVATIAAATTLVLGIGDTLAGPGGPRGRLLPLQAASPTATNSPPAPGGTLSEMPGTSPSSAPTIAPSAPTSRAPAPAPDPTPLPSERQALLQFRDAVGEGVDAGDIRQDVGIDFDNLVERMLTHPRTVNADFTELQNKITTRTREGAVSPRRAGRLRQILERATP